MAARTLTYTINMNAVPSKIHSGVNIVAWDFNSGATKLGTLSDVVMLGKVPNGALIVSSDVRCGASTAAAAHWALVLLRNEGAGTMTNVTTLIASMTASTAAQQFSSPAPYKISLSDDAAVQFAVLALNCTTGASETVSVSIQGNIHYVSDGRNV